MKSTKMKLTYILFMSIFLLPACSKKDGGSSTKTLNSQPNIVELPEPSIHGKTARFQLTKLAAVQEKFLKLNDSIVFTGLEKKQSENESSFKNIKLYIKTHCILNQEKVIIREFNRPLKETIPLIELLPTEVLLDQINTPSCGFSFKAQNKEGAAHHFELPQLPIINHTTNRFIQLFNSLGRINATFPYVFMNKISDYWLDTGTQEQINLVNLICDDFSLSLPIRPQQFIPFSAFPLDELNTQITQKVTKSNSIQKCRIFGYKKNILTGVSSVFHLLYPQPPLHVSIVDSLFEHEDKQQLFYFEIMQTDGRDKENRPDIPLYSYIIRNPRNHPVYILIENYKKRERELLLDFYGLYYKEGESFYVLHDELMHLSGVQTIEGETIQKNTEEGHIIKLNPGSQITFSIILKERFGLCSVVRNKSHWLGAVVRFPDLKIYQLVSDQIDLVPLSQNILHQLDTHPGKSFNILTTYLIGDFASKTFSNVWFRQGICDGSIVSDTIDPVIELYRAFTMKPLKIRWIESTPVSERDYLRTNRAINGIINELNNR